jgi:hypothetical protein
MSPIRLHNAWRWSSIFLSFTLFVPSYQLIKTEFQVKSFSEPEEKGGQIENEPP